MPSSTRQAGCALVTGASRGIGRACAVALAADGWPVVVNYRKDRAGAEVTVQESKLVGGQAVSIQSDISVGRAAVELVEASRDAFGDVAILVNNAGHRDDGLSLQLSDEAWMSVINTNLEAPFRLCRAVLPRMIRARFGRIVNVASVAGMHASRGQANYAASKAGLIGLTKTIAAEVAGRGITVNAVAPGYVTTEMTADVSDDVLRGIPVGRFGAPEEIAACVRFLASEEASYVTGTVLVADGGFTA